MTSGMKCSRLSGLLPPGVAPRGRLLRLGRTHGDRVPACVFPGPRARPFHTGRPLRYDSDSSQDHYETLKVPLDASHADIKKSFYRLSKIHHPDHNRSDPHAKKRFVRLSEAYSVLSHAEKRAIYDREYMRIHYGRGYGPAGGRPASGLSRRSPFGGPPSSMYYRNMEFNEASAHAPGGGTHGRTRHAHRPGTGAGAGPGPGNVNDRDTGTRRDPNTPHFDWDATERSHRNFDERKEQRRAAQEAHGELFRTTEPTMAGAFLIISAALVVGVIVPALLFGARRKKKAKAKQAKEAKGAGVADASSVAAP